VFIEILSFFVFFFLSPTLSLTPHKRIKKRRGKQNATTTHTDKKTQHTQKRKRERRGSSA
jgi:Mg2+/citrate symporter